MDPPHQLVKVRTSQLQEFYPLGKTPEHRTQPKGRPLQGAGDAEASSRPQPLPFSQALAVARSLGLADAPGWRAWCKTGARPPSMPTHPSTAYAKAGWQGWGHWLGAGDRDQPGKAPRFLPFDQAVGVAQSLGLASSTEWHAWGKEGMRPCNVPSNPQRTYKESGWQGWRHWLGTGTTATMASAPHQPARHNRHATGPATAGAATAPMADKIASPRATTVHPLLLPVSSRKRKRERVEDPVAGGASGACGEGDGTPDTLAATCARANALQKQGKHDEAAALVAQALASM